MMNKKFYFTVDVQKGKAYVADTNIWMEEIEVETKLPDGEYKIIIDTEVNIFKPKSKYEDVELEIIFIDAKMKPIKDDELIDTVYNEFENSMYEFILNKYHRGAL